MYTTDMQKEYTWDFKNVHVEFGSRQKFGKTLNCSIYLSWQWNIPKEQFSSLTIQEANVCNYKLLFFPLKDSYTPQLISSNPSLANHWFELMVITAEFGEKKICICNIPMNQSGFTLCWLKRYKVNFSLPHSKGYLMMKSPNSCEHIKRCWLFEIIVAILS